MKPRQPLPRPTMPYFDNLPPTALPALQAAWDKARENFSMTAIFDGFSRDINALKYVAPTRPECNEWVEAVRSGLVVRPTKLFMQEVQEAFTPLTPETFPLPQQPDGGAMPDLVPEAVSDRIPVIPPAAVIEFLGERGLKAEIASRLSSVRDELIAETCAGLQNNIRLQATRIVAGQLRVMADEMEGGAT